jgi:hypothetical protein
MTRLDSRVSEQRAVADCCGHGVVSSGGVQAGKFLGARRDNGVSGTPFHRVTSLLLTYLLTHSTERSPS